MHADERTRVVIHREWILDTPAHHTEVAKALTVAGQKREAETGNVGDIVFTHGDDQIVIGYQVEGSPTGLRREAEARLQAERQEFRRAAESAEVTLKRVQDLAVEWSAVGGPSAANWREASRMLHETLDGPSDEEPAR